MKIAEIKNYRTELGFSEPSTDHLPAKSIEACVKHMLNCTREVGSICLVADTILEIGALTAIWVPKAQAKETMELLGVPLVYQTLIMDLAKTKPTKTEVVGYFSCRTAGMVFLADAQARHEIRPKGKQWEPTQH